MLLLHLWSDSRRSDDTVIVVHVLYVQEVMVPHLGSARTTSKSTKQRSKQSYRIMHTAVNPVYHLLRMCVPISSELPSKETLLLLSVSIAPHFSESIIEYSPVTKFKICKQKTRCTYVLHMYSSYIFRHTWNVPGNTASPSHHLQHIFAFRFC